MRKREEFAVSLRKKKKELIIKERRKRLIVSNSQVQEPCDTEKGYSYSNNKMYNFCPLFLEEGPLDPSKLHSLQEILQRVLPEYPTDLPEEIAIEELARRKCEQVEILLDALFSK
jgi:hypothetical protein